jgi:hypothetical protein
VWLSSPIIFWLIFGPIDRSRYREPLVPQTEYAGLRLGLSPDEVMNIKGLPPAVVAEAPDPSSPAGPEVGHIKVLGNDEHPQDYHDWVYVDPDLIIFVTFNPEKSAVIAIGCWSDHVRRCPSIAGVSNGDSEGKAIQKLGVA